MNIDYEKTLAFTGHRPDKLFGYDYCNKDNLKMLLKLKALICRYIEKKNINTFISGMALGIDMWSAQLIISLKKRYPHIKLVCAIPCKEQYKKWNKEDIVMWHEIVNNADYVYYVSEEPYNNWCMEKRNRWIVDNSNHCIAVWDGSEGGTYNCIKYAIKRQRTVMRFHPTTFEMNFIKSIDISKK